MNDEGAFVDCWLDAAAAVVIMSRATFRSFVQSSRYITMDVKLVLFYCYFTHV